MRRIIALIMAIFLGSIYIATPVFAADKCVLTAILGSDYCDADGNKLNEPYPADNKYSCSCDDGNGSSITGLIRLVINTLSIGTGVFGVIAIVFSGIQYITAGDNENKTRAAKTRIKNIVIGLIVYVVAFSVLVWLIPGFKGLMNL